MILAFQGDGERIITDSIVSVTNGGEDATHPRQGFFRLIVSREAIEGLVLW